MGRRFEQAACLLLLLCLLLFAGTTIRWPVTGDAALIHYVAADMAGGARPYTDIGDINLPGSYLPDAIAEHFHDRDLAWRVYDFGLLCVIIFGGWLILERRLVPAIWAGTLFSLIHARDGVEQVGQRDLAGTALLVIGTAFLVRARHRKNKFDAAIFGILVGAAATVKPTLALFILLPIVELIRRRDADVISPMIWASGGGILHSAHRLSRMALEDWRHWWIH